ncbi:MAG: Ubiquinone/menaquinone biosynthesis C-methyltransferase UbiE [Candidatus Heimdallarchaeota archaeon LC_3]|nr:MAG: Ubiquinone/menaquinone biosynthesis C-methyltransferase UbiE [Candidatus Heimdallarchaeota archaeon LC_3]OLS21013.1 MAG: Ubiquinone/menaquinone biosynthesis C-methyltransferase UbiE [Candidatus Heimdallarchaeota archaeon LC_3]
MVIALFGDHILSKISFIEHYLDQFIFHQLMHKHHRYFFKIEKKIFIVTTNDSNIFSQEDTKLILSQLGINNQLLFTQNVEHFTNKEGPKRDQIVENYFGKEGMRILISEINKSIQLNPKNSLIDLGVGTGTFLLPILKESSLSEILCFDATPKMLELLLMKITNDLEKIPKIHLVIGDMEQITRSLEVNNNIRKLKIPTKVDRIISSLALHHVQSTSKVLKGIAEILEKNGKAVIVDAIHSDTSGMVPSPEHAHDGFKFEELENLALEIFKSVNVKELEVKCNDPTCPSRGTGLFLMELSDPIR